MDATKLDHIFEEFKKEVSEFAKDEKNRCNFYDYEKKFREITQKYEQEVFQTTIGAVPASKNKKKTVKCTFGSVALPNESPLCQCPGGFQISPLLQDHMTRIGSKLVFEESSEELELLLGINVNAKQIERVCHYYGELLERIEWREAYSDGVQLKLQLKPEEDIYVMVDGSMLLTREEKWKEIKLGRIFTSGSMGTISKDRGKITDTLYASHLGNAEAFWEKWSKEIPGNGKLVFINDGAKWIWNYIDDHYPNSIQILDFFHCKEHIYGFAKLFFKKDKAQAERFVNLVTDLLFAKQVDCALDEVSSLKCSNKTMLKEKEKLLKYLTTNKKRINYGEYIKQGWLIGSGAIEAAHRDVLQKRLKLSGQRWTIKGAQQMANLRTYKKSNNWDQVKSLIVNNKEAA
jgi:hypothetical protein